MGSRRSGMTPLRLRTGPARAVGIATRLAFGSLQV